MASVTSKTALIVFAHENPYSFNAALKDVAVEQLKIQGYHVEVSDLYAQHFEPKASRNDIIGKLKDQDHYDYSEEAEAAHNNGMSSHDIMAEREKITRATLVIFQFPMYWFSVPAILKGWFDRVLVNGFAFNYPQVFDKGFMKGKKAILSFTANGSDKMYSERGIMGDLDVILWPIHYGTLRFCGFDVLNPQLSHSMKYSDEALRLQFLQNWQTRLKTIDTEKPKEFIPITNFDLNRTFTLSDNYIKSEEQHNYAPTVGQHLGKQILKK